jgi:hypothetical protein
MYETIFALHIFTLPEEVWRDVFESICDKIIQLLLKERVVLSAALEEATRYGSFYMKYPSN